MTERSNEPVLARAALRPFVQAAQNQPIAPTRLSAHEVQRAWVQARREHQHTRRTLAIGVGLGLAAAAILAVVGTSLMDHTPARDRNDVAIQTEPSETGVIPVIPSQPLDAAVRIRSDHGAEPPRVLGPWSIALDAGTHEIAVAAAEDRALRIELPERTLELVHGTMTIEVVDRSAVVHLESGVAAWIEADGTRTQIEVERIELAGDPSGESAAPHAAEPVVSEPSASELARAAERELMAGQRDEAIALLRKLVRKYPRTPQARTALMDLAVQERLAGATDRARCAYLLYLERWPHSEVRAEIDKQLGKLGNGPACRGLDPR
jgi:hypothetical protein